MVSCGVSAGSLQHLSVTRTRLPGFSLTITGNSCEVRYEPHEEPISEHSRALRCSETKMYDSLASILFQKFEPLSVRRREPSSTGTSASPHTAVSDQGRDQRSESNGAAAALTHLHPTEAPHLSIGDAFRDAGASCAARVREQSHCGAPRWEARLRLHALDAIRLRTRTCTRRPQGDFFEIALRGGVGPNPDIAAIYRRVSSHPLTCVLPRLGLHGAVRVRGTGLSLAGSGGISHNDG